MPQGRRAPLLALGVLALLGGLWGALARLGVPVEAPEPVQTSHGLLMAMGFLGTVISLERAVALGRRPAYAAPVLAGGGAVALLLGLTIAPWVLAAAALAFAATCAYMWRLHPELSVAAMLLGGLAWAAAAIGIAVGLPVSRAVPLITAFLVLTIAGERVELSKLARPPAWSRIPFAVGCALLVVGAVLATQSADGTRLAGIGLLLIAIWLGLWDFAWRSVTRAGVTRYMAVALIAGYVWLAAGGITWIVVPDPSTVFANDAFIHTVLVGFVLSMIFAHELMIVPALLGIALPFTRVFYAPLALLHLSLAARIAGDIAGDPSVWRWAGTTNVIAILFLAAVTMTSVRQGRAHRRNASLRPKSPIPSDG